MKRITLAGIHDSLVTMQHEVTVPKDVRVRAEQAINRMLALPKTVKPLDFQVGRPAADVEMFA
jgi:quinolinate synthase